MGRRSRQIPLRKAVFNLMPEKLDDTSAVYETEDPEYSSMHRVYTLCYMTIFNKSPKNAHRVLEYRDEIASEARQAKCSIRMYMLAAMLGYERERERAAEGAAATGHVDREYSVEMHPKFLVNKRAAQYVEIYGDLCRQQFGTFNASELNMLMRGQRGVITELHTKILYSEVIAGKFIVAMKANRAGQVEEELYRRFETALDPHWLAVEPSYVEQIISPFIRERFGTKTEQNHRHNVISVLKLLKEKPTAGSAVHFARSAVMPQAVERVLATHRYNPDDFEIEASTVTNAFAFWKDLGRAIQQMYCLSVYRSQIEENPEEPYFA
jgi:hypothetical protein